MPTIAAMYGVKWMNDSPPSVSTSRISSVAYATEDSASLAKTGKRDLLGQQRLAEAVAPDRPADHAALQQAREQTHGAECYAACAWQVP